MNVKYISSTVFTRNAFSERLIENAVMLRCFQFISFSSKDDTKYFENIDEETRVFKAKLPFKSSELPEKGFDPSKLSYIDLMGLSDRLFKEVFEDIIGELSSFMIKGSSIALDFRCIQANSSEQTVVAKYSYSEMEKLLSKYGFLIYEHMDHNDINDQFLYQYNIQHIRHQLKAPEELNFCLAVKHR